MRGVASIRFSSILVLFLVFPLLPHGDAALIGWWPFDDLSKEIALDRSRNENHLELEGASFIETGEEISGGALKFAGDGGRAVRDTTAGLGVTTSLTIEVWIKPDPAIVNHDANALVLFGDMRYVFGIEKGKLRGYLWGAEPGGPEGFQQVQGASRVPVGTWCHAAFTFDGSRMRLYLDGEVDGSADFGGTISQGGNTCLLLGNASRGTFSMSPFLGLMDELHILDEALEEHELDFHAGLYAQAGRDQTVFSGDDVILDGTGSRNAETHAWEQVVLGEEPEVSLQETGTPGVVTFTSPSLSVGVVLHFRLTVTKGEASRSDDISVTVRARNRPMLAPWGFETLPVHLGFILSWKSLIDADAYIVEIQTPLFEWLPVATTSEPRYELETPEAGQLIKLRVKARNEYGDSDPSEDVSLTTMSNLALPESLGGATPPSEYVCKASRESVVGINNGRHDDHVDSSDGRTKREDYWGYIWEGPFFFDQVVYFTGDILREGGWFTELSVQYTEDGTSWREAPSVRVTPRYNFANAPADRDGFARYDITFATVRGKGIRIYGRPGGMGTFTSISELEVYGDQTRGPLVVQGIDADVPEGRTATLDGSYSFSTRGPMVTYRWEQVSGPTVSIQNGESAVASFDTFGVEEDTVLVFSLTAGDGTEEATDSDVCITIENVNTTADAGPDQSVSGGTTVILDGSASLTASGNITYLWTHVVGLPVALSDADAAVCTFTAPRTWALVEPLTFQLEVDDGLGQPGSVSTDEVNVTVTNSLFGVAVLGPGYFKDLLHLGQTPADRFLGPLFRSLDTNDYLGDWGGQANVNPMEGDEYDFSDTEISTTSNPMVWTPVHSDTGFFADERLDCFGQIYHIYLFSPEEREARLRFRHDENVRIWNNGTLAAARDTRDGGVEQFEDFTLDAGINSMTLRLEEGSGQNYLTAAITDRNDLPYTDLLHAVSVPNPLPSAYVVRSLPPWLEPGSWLEVELSIRADPYDAPASVIISERIPAGLTVEDAGGGMVVGGNINWTLTGAQVGITDISYTLSVPQDLSGGLFFDGTVNYAGVSHQRVWGDGAIYRIPASPENLTVEIQAAARLSWSASPSAGVVGYNVYRRVDGGAWEKIARVTETSYADESVVPGRTYCYRVSAVNVRGVEGPFSDTACSAPLPTEIIEAEDYDEAFYSDGWWPPWPPWPVLPAEEKDPPGGWLYFRAPCGEYRPPPQDGPHIIPGPEEGEWVIGFASPGDWWKYNLDVPEAGWVRIELRVSSSAGGEVELYWDDVLTGTIRFVTGGWDVYGYFLLEESFQDSRGPHTLRVELASGQMNFDKVVMAYNAPPPARQTVFEEDFDAYGRAIIPPGETLEAAGWSIVNGSGYPDARWQLWSTSGEPLGMENPDLDGMSEMYMITNSDLAPEAEMDEELITPEIDCTNWVKLRLDFNKNFRVYPDDVDHLQIGEVDVRAYDEATSTWGGWENLLRYDTTTVAEIDSRSERLDLSSYDGKRIQVRWHFYEAVYDYWFAVDEIRVSGEFVPPEPPPPPRGLDWRYDERYGECLCLCIEEFGDGYYTVEYTDDLVGENWKPVEGISWPVADVCVPICTRQVFETLTKRFFRVRSE